MASTTKIVMRVEYDGTGYHGFQWQANAPTVQAEIERALEKLTGEKLRVLAASRTDAGVHARGQVISFRTQSVLSPETFLKGLNHYLPADIAISFASRVEDDFDVRRLPVSRHYRYCLLNSLTPSPLWRHFALFYPWELDLEAMRLASSQLVGEQDFASFASSLGGWVRGTVRRVYKVEVNRKGSLLLFDFFANAFLPHQIRNTVGALLKVGRGKMGVGEFRQMAEAKKPGLAGPAVSPNGLCLMAINYPQPLGV